MDKRIVVTGIGIISPSGLNKISFWDSLSRGISAIRSTSSFDTSEFSSHKSAEVISFNPRDYIKRKSIRQLDKISRFAIVASFLALKDAGLEIDVNNSNQISIVFGSMYCGWTSIAEFHRQMLEDRLKRVDPLLFPNVVPNSPASQISIEFGIRGLNTTLTTGFVSGTDAIGWGLNYLRRNKAMVVLAGGAEELTCWLLGSFEKLGYLAKANNKIEECCRPFDKNRNGLVLGEGSAMLVLEALENVPKKNGKIYAEIIGYGSTCNTSKNGEGLERAICLALEEAKINPSSVDYINAEGNSTILSDRLESSVLKKIFGKSIYKIPISSIKPIIGHTLGAAGAFDAVACILAIENGLIPPTINYEEPDPECDLDYVPNVARNKRISIAISYSFEPGGNSACLVFKKKDNS
jgi:3-oxoacyl-[acyl-carrier-protein] synthase II